MSLVHIPLTRAEPSGSAVERATVRAMEVGRHLIAVVLTAIGVIRAIGDGLVCNLGHGMLGWTLAMGSGERAVALATQA